MIGAGINGAAIARDAAMRGLSVLLLDKGDIGGGTSSWSTRLIHGGLRYLEHGELGLVRESLRERETLFRVAPHLVKPLPMLIPIYRQARRGWWTVRAGMIAYDALSYDKSLPRHRMLSRNDALEMAPGLNEEGLLGAALYYDAQVEFPERLVLENVLSAKHYGACVKTYSRVHQFIVEHGQVLGVEFTDCIGSESHSVTGSVTINAAGPWVDEVVDKLAARRMIGGTKGSHIIVERFPGAPETALYVEAKADHRPFFIIPWNSNLLIGTTDKHFNGNLDAVEIDEAEVEYLLAETNRVIPRANLRRESIRFTYSGVRPLPFTSNSDEPSITRRHFIHHHAPNFSNLFSIVGGKLTTYRSLSEQAVDLIFSTLNRKVPPCKTKEERLPGANAPDFATFIEQFKSNCNCSPQSIDHLLRVYGTRALEVLQLTKDDPELESIVDEETGAVAAEVVFAFREELALTLADCLLRRTMIGLNSTAGIGADEIVAQVAQRYSGWSSERARGEVDSYRNNRRSESKL